MEEPPLARLDYCIRRVGGNGSLNGGSLNGKPKTTTGQLFLERS